MKKQPNTKMQGNNTLIKVIQSKGQSTLVEFIHDGVSIRKFVPSDEVINGMVADQVLERAIPYGYPWSEISLTFDANMFEREMHNRELWTIEEALRNPKKLKSAIDATLASQLSSVLQIAHSEKKRS